MSEFLEVRGAKTHNLKNVDVKIPKNTLTVITWLSGSGKSSLAFSTIYSIGQQKYLESLSSYARMFVGNTKDEALYDEITGLSPTISIDQKTTNRNPRSTVGTITEIYDYYKLLYLNIGERKCISCGSKIQKDSVRDIIWYISSFPQDTKFFLSAPILKNKRDLSPEKIKKEILDAWFIRFLLNGKEYNVNAEFELPNAELKVDIIVDRLVVKDFSVAESADTKRLKDSIDVSYKVWNGQLSIHIITENTIKKRDFSQIFVCSDCGHIPEKLSISSFSFNSHHGACPECHGLGEKMVFLEETLVNPRLTLEEGAVLPPGFWNYFLALIAEVGKKHQIRTDIPYAKLSSEERMKVMYGTGEMVYSVTFINEQGRRNTYNSKFEGVIRTLERRYYDGGVESGNYDDFVTNISCPSCDGYRLSPEPLSVFINGKHIWQLSNYNIRETQNFFHSLKLSIEQQKIVEKVQKNILERLEFLEGVWLSYMTLSRRANTLSGGEAQRIRLATQIGVKLEWIIYVLDEPSIGLHPRDNDMLIKNLKKLRDVWNTLIVVEHDEDIMRESDYIIDIGPGAGIHGGNIVATGDFNAICSHPNSVTGPYLSGQKTVIVDSKKRKKWKMLTIYGAKHHNLKNITVDFPVGHLTVVTGVSWSGKSSLINDILANYLANTLNRASKTVWQFDRITGVENFDKVLVIDQSPIGKTPRSNPATYTGVFTFIRDVFAASYDAKLRGYGPGRFSFNTRDGRCSECDGDGVKKIEMHFLPPVYTTCEVCEGKRFNAETLEIRYKGKTISDILDMTVEEALDFFHAHPRIVKILDILNKVWLWYIGLGQASTTLSGWEAQRIKLASELSKRSTTQTIYILDEPTTGLHFQDIEKLLHILHTLVDKWNTVIVIEHNMNIIMNADHIIDIWPEWGDEWGTLVVSWERETVKNCGKSYTWQAILKYENHLTKK
jgi:excinuclease ABC subunit A